MQGKENGSVKNIFASTAKQKKPRNIYYNAAPKIVQKGEEKLFAVPEPWPGIVVRTKKTTDK